MDGSNTYGFKEIYLQLFGKFSPSSSGFITHHRNKTLLKNSVGNLAVIDHT